jgi:hypothetical protein
MGIEAQKKRIAHLRLEVRIDGEWLWVSGDTKPHRIELSDAGFRYSGRKQMWYWSAKLDRRKTL